jgi:hypothetical protein
MSEAIEMLRRGDDSDFAGISEILPKKQTLGEQLGAITGYQQHLTTSIDMTNMAGRQLIVQCMQECDARLTDVVNTEIHITDFMAHNVRINGKEPGEVIDAVRLVVIDKDRMRYECVSATLLRSLGQLLFLFGEPPWKQPIKVKVKTRRQKERNIYWFEPIE